MQWVPDPDPGSEPGGQLRNISEEITRQLRQLSEAIAITEAAAATGADGDDPAAVLGVPGGLAAWEADYARRQGIYDEAIEQAARRPATSPERATAEANGELPAQAEPDPLAEFRAVMAERLGLDGEELGRLVPDPAPGMCRACHAAPFTPPETLCYYCAALVRLQAASMDPPWRPACEHGSGMQCMNCYPPAVRAACDHGPRGRFIRDGRCRRCGQFAAPHPGMHLHQPGQRRCGACEPRRVPSLPARIMLIGLGVALLVLAAHFAAALALPAFACFCLAGLRWRR